MKKILLHSTTLLAILSASPASAQISTASENLDINLFKAAHMVHGDMWYNTVTSTPACEYPKGSGKHANFMSSIWMGGFDASHTLKGAATMYRSAGVDYYPGPLDSSGKCTAGSSSEWAKIWKVNASTIQEFRLAYETGGASAITAAKYDVIKEWPAVGNIYAVGATGTSLSALLSTTVDVNGYAPFVDVNGDKLYNWKDGDYPKIKGDQMLWWIFNDNTNTHLQSKTGPMGLEIQVSAYAYSRGSAVDRMMFYEYKVLNRSNTAYDNFVFSLFSDADLGYPFDDALAVDSNRRMVVEFNPNADAPNGANSYGSNPPLAALSLAEMPGDIYPSGMQKVGGFAYFKNTPAGPIRAPKDMVSFYNYMTGYNADGDPITYVYSLNRELYNLNAVWNPCDSPSMLSADRRYIVSTKPYTFLAKSAIKVGMVFMATDTNTHTCPDLKLKEIKDLADTAWVVYWNPLPLGIEAANLVSNNFKLYPNPAKSILYVQTNGITNNQEQLKIVDALGKSISVAMTHNGTTYEINIGSLASGMYVVVYFDGSTMSTQRFVKE